MATSLGGFDRAGHSIAGLEDRFGLATMIWLVFFLLFGFVSLASIAAAVALPILMVVF